MSFVLCNAFALLINWMASCKAICNEFFICGYYTIIPVNDTHGEEIMEIMLLFPIFPYPFAMAIITCQNRFEAFDYTW